MLKRNLPFIRKILVFSLFFLVFFVATLPSAAQTGTDPLHVATSGADNAVCGTPAAPCRSLQYAVAKAKDGGLIKLASGVFTGVQGIPPGSDAPVLVNITKSLSIQGGYTVTNWLGSNPVANVTLLDARQQGRVLRAVGHITVNVSGVSMVNGVITGGVGGGIYNDQARLTLNDVIMADNRAVGDSTGRTGGFGGAIYNAGQMVITRTTLLRNVAQGGAGATGLCYAGGGGGGAGLGGGIYNLGALTIVSSTLANNRAFGGNGGLATATTCQYGRVGRGGRGGGAGGAGAISPDWPGEPGRFGGGGGGGADTSDSEDIIGYGSAGGQGGFGGGGGGKGLYEFEYPDTPGGFGGGAGDVGGGGGAGIGGALFDLNDGANVQGVVFAGNVAAGGAGGNLAYQPIVGQSLVGHPGQGIGPDVFTYSAGVSNRARPDLAKRGMTGLWARESMLLVGNP